MTTANAQEIYDGVEVAEFVVKIPAITADSDHYPLGTVLRLAVEVQLSASGYEPRKDGRLVKTQKGKVTELAVVSSFNPSADLTTATGSASGRPLPDTDDTALPVQLARSSDTWPKGVADGPITPGAPTARVYEHDGMLIDADTGEVLGEVVDATEHLPGPGEQVPERDEPAVDPQPDRDPDQDATDELVAMAAGAKAGF